MEVVVQLLAGDNAGGRSIEVTADQRAGRACLQCSGADPAHRIGWYGPGDPALVHPWCVGAWQLREPRT